MTDTSTRSVTQMAIDFEVSAELSCFRSNREYRAVAETLRTLAAERDALKDSLRPDTHYGNAKIVTLRRDVNSLRTAIRNEGTPAIQYAWDMCERWVDRIFVENPKGPDQ